MFPLLECDDDDGAHPVSAGLYLVAGICLLLAVVLPQALRRFAISPPIVLVAVGMLIGISPLPETFVGGTGPDTTVVEHVTEVTVRVALMGVGLALNRPLDLRSADSWRRWSSTWRLLAIAMPLGIAAVALLGWWAVGLAPATAVLLGAVLAPTDPVLASDVQVSGPSVAGGTETYEAGLDEEDGDEVRFALTAEAGFNDGLAFPFIHLALLLAAGGFAASDAAQWFGWYAVTKVLLGTVVGVAVGWVMGRAAFRSQTPALRLAEQGESLLAVAALLTAYGAAELAGGYGFLAVFSCAMTVRAAERGHEYHRAMHDVVERLERLLTLVILLVLGVATTRGLLEHLDWNGVLVGVCLVLVIRPLTGLVSLTVGARPADRRGGLTVRERLIVSFFGVRGVGSLYYLAYAVEHGEFADVPWLWSTVGFTIILSVVVHGVTATPVLIWLEEGPESTVAGPDRG